MKRRELITLLGGVAIFRPLKVLAQQAAVPVIGYFSSRSPDAEAPLLKPFLKSLAESGFTAGHNVAIEYRFAEGQDERLAALVAELVGRPATILVATDRPSAMAAKAATATIPIVFASGADPVQLGLVAGFNRPGGNATGVTLLTTELGPKRLGLLRDLLPKPGTIAFVVNAHSAWTAAQVREMETAAQSIGQPLLVVSVASEEQIDQAFASMAEQKVVALLYSANLWFQVISKRLVALAAHYRIPALYEWREFVVAGGLMSYSTERNEVGRETGVYAARILKGEKAADLPVVQSSRFELVINLNTAKALGLDLPPTLLARADELIE
jgi:putative ABC transport system substrate-binding protein